MKKFRLLILIVTIPFFFQACYKSTQSDNPCIPHIESEFLPESQPVDTQTSYQLSESPKYPQAKKYPDIDIQDYIIRREKIAKVIPIDLNRDGEKELVVATIYPWFEEEEWKYIPDDAPLTPGSRVGRLRIFAWDGVDYVEIAYEDCAWGGTKPQDLELEIGDINKDGKIEIILLAPSMGNTFGITVYTFLDDIFAIKKLFDDVPKHGAEVKDIDGDGFKEILLECFAPDEERTKALDEKRYDVSVTKIYKWNTEDKKYELFKITPPHKVGESVNF